MTGKNQIRLRKICQTEKEKPSKIKFTRPQVMDFKTDCELKKVSLWATIGLQAGL